MVNNYEDCTVELCLITYYMMDSNGNPIRNENGTLKQFDYTGRIRLLEHLCDDMDPQDMVEIKDDGE